MRSVLAGLVLIAGCARNSSSIEVHGSLTDGTALDGTFPAALDPLASPWKMDAAAAGPEEVRGFWLWFDTAVTSGTSYPSSGSDPATGPVHFYVVRPDPSDGGAGESTASLIDGGAIVFSSVGPDVYSGTLANLVLSRSGQILVTIDHGSFVAARN